MLSHTKSFWFFILFLPTFLMQSNVSVDTDYLQAWKTKYIDKMSIQEKQILANIIHLLHANSVIEFKTREFLTPITRLNQTIRNNIDQYKNSQEDLVTLKTLLDRLGIVIGTRLIYNQTLNAGVAYYNKNTIHIIDAALAELQLYAQEKLRNWSNQNEEKCNDLLERSSQNIASTIQHFQGISQLHHMMSEGKLPVQISKQDEENKSLIKLSILLKNNPELFAVLDTIAHTLNETTDYACQVILVGTEIYKQFYMILYESLMAPDTDKNYTTTLFSMHGLLPDEYKSTLPNANHVFEHMLQTTKMYTQIEFLPS